jgi:hypothetical protein
MTAPPVKAPTARRAPHLIAFERSTRERLFMAEPSHSALVDWLARRSAPALRG